LSVISESFCPEEILPYLGTGGAKTEAWEEIVAIAKNLQEEFASDLLARSRATIVPASIYGEGEVILAGTVMPCNTRWFCGAAAAALTVITVGEKAIQEERRLFQCGEYLESLVLNAIINASLNREQMKIRRQLKERLAVQGIQLGYTLSPGCQNIPLKIQEVILSLILSLNDAEKIGVTVNSAYMLQPVQSVSAIIPLGIDLAFISETGNSCDICEAGRMCGYRQTV
jgi:hypothetical protein